MVNKIKVCDEFPESRHIGAFLFPLLICAYSSVLFLNLNIFLRVRFTEITMMIHLVLLRVLNPILFKREGNNVDTPPFQNDFYLTFDLPLLKKTGAAPRQIYRFKNLSQILGLKSFLIPRY